MAKKPRSSVADYAVYVAVRVAVCAIQAVPLRVALGLANALAWLAYKVDRRHREVARENLRYALPERCADPAECDRLVRACYRHFLTVLVEIACLPRRFHIHNWRSFGTPVHFDRIVNPLLDKRAALLVTAHYGNWEVAGYVTGLVGLRTYAIARVLDNRYLNRFMQQFRRKTGQEILSKTGDFDRITAVLEGGGTIATLGDQDAGPKGMFVDFFNRPASTHKAVALMSLQFDAPMVVIGIPRIGTPMRFALEIEDLIDPRDYAGTRNAVKVMTDRFTQAIERMVRRHPEQYFWLHRRWKHQPLAKQAASSLPSTQKRLDGTKYSGDRAMFSIRLTTIALLVLASGASAEDKKPVKDDAKWQSLFDGKTMTGWKLSYSAGSGKVEVKDGAIIMPKGEKMTGVTYDKKDFPKTDYEVVLEGKRVDGGDFFCTTTFPVGDSFCSLVVGGWGGRVTGLSSINGSDASENETTGSMDFKNGEWYKVRIRVSAKKIEAWIGNEQVVDLEPKGRKMSTRIECEECQPFGVCTWDTTGAVRDIKVRLLTDEEKKGSKERK